MNLTENTDTKSSEIPSAEELGRIFRHLHRLTPRRFGKVAKRARLLRHARFRFGTTRPDEETLNEISTSLSLGTEAHWRERVVAAWTLGWADLTATQQQIARHRLSEVVRGKAEDGRNLFGFPLGTWVFSSVVWFFGCIAVAILQSIVMDQIPMPLDRTNSIPDPFWNYVFSVFGMAVVSTAALSLLAPIFGIYCATQQRSHTHSIRVEAARALGRIGGVKGVSVLLHASRNPLFFSEVGKKSLASVLPALTEADYGTLDADAVPSLCLLLDPRHVGYRNSEEAWQFLVLDALAKVGNAQALKSLEQYRDYQSNLLLTARAERAARTLAIVQNRLARETERATLLRGSESPVMPETFLRPATYVPSETEAKQLLRPTQGV